MMPGRHNLCVLQRLFFFTPSPITCPKLTHTALVPPLQVPRGLHNFPPRCVEEARSVESVEPVPEPWLCLVPAVQPGVNGHSFLICEMGTQCLPSRDGMRIK